MLRFFFLPRMCFHLNNQKPSMEQKQSKEFRKKEGVRECEHCECARMSVCVCVWCVCVWCVSVNGLCVWFKCDVCFGVSLVMYLFIMNIFVGFLFSYVCCSTISSISLCLN